MIEDENTSSSEREAAKVRVAEREEELARLRTQIQERNLPLRERIKKIFKKYGFTVTAVLLAVGTTIGFVVSSLTKGLKSVAKGAGKGLQELGKKKRLHSARPAGLDRELCVSHGRSGYLLSW